jgi:hypothetical protein
MIGHLVRKKRSRRTIMGDRPNGDELTVLLSVYQVERQDEHHAGTFALTLVTVGVAYITAATALIYQCRAEQACKDDNVLNLALLFLPLAPVALLGFLAMNLAAGAIRGSYLEALEHKLSMVQVETDDGLRIPSYTSLLRSMYARNTSRPPYRIVMYLSFSALPIIVTIFIVGVALAARPDNVRWIVMVIYLFIEACELFIMLRSPHDFWERFRAQTRSSLSAT